MRWTRRSPATPPASRSRSSAGNRLTVTDNGRGIPVDPHPKYPGKSALEVIMTTLHSGGKFEGKAYSTSRRPPRRRGQRRQRAVERDHRRGRARQEALPPDLLPRPRHLEARGRRRRPQPPRHHRHLHPRPRDLRRRRRASTRRASTSSPAPRPISSPGSRSAGAATRRSPRADVPEAAVFQFPGGLADHLAEQLGDRADASPASPSPAARTSPTSQGSAEWAVAWPLWSDGTRKLLLQHHPDPRRRHPRSGPPRRADQGHPRVRRAGRQQEGQGHHRRRRLQRRRADARRSSSATRISRARPRTA